MLHFQTAENNAHSHGLDCIVREVCTDHSLLVEKIETIIRDFPQKLSKWVPHVVRQLRRRKDLSPGSLPLL